MVDQHRLDSVGCPGDLALEERFTTFVEQRICHRQFSISLRTNSAMRPLASCLVTLVTSTAFFGIAICVVMFTSGGGSTSNLCSICPAISAAIAFGGGAAGAGSGTF